MSRRPHDTGPVIIKKYANRRLYDTETSTYVTLEDICKMVKQDKEFLVQDAKTGEDLTRQILTQIILEQELKGSGMMPPDFLRNVIKMHEGQMGAMVQSYLDSSIKAFAANQDMFRQYMETGMESFGKMSPLAQMEDLTKRNVDMFQKAFDMFNPTNFNPAKFFGGKDDEKKGSS